MIGRTISHYKILEKLGEGGMGVVYKAEDTKLKRTVALKFLSEQAVGTDEDKQRFTQEARAAAALNHPNICTIHEIDEVDDRSFITMEYVEGDSLKNKIQSGPVSIDDVLNIALQIAEGLEEAHQKDIIHRDIKPGNIMLAANRRVKIMDFGLAKALGEAQLTRTGTTVGTVAYMSPEQTRGEEVDSRSDVWALGVVLYEMITGRRPFTGEHEQAVIYSIVNEDPEPVTGLRTGVPIELENIILRCLEKDAAHRYQSAADLIADILRVQTSLTSQRKSTTAAKPDKKQGNWWWVVALIVLVVSAVYLYPVLFDRSADTTVDSDRRMIVVLPFENLGSPDDEYFVKGITDAITARLAGLHGLGVISRQSAMLYRDSHKSIREIGEELGVEYILEGTVQRERPGDPTSRIRIIPQLIRVADDTHMWADTYDEDMSEVFRVQSSVAGMVASELEITLLQPERKELETKPTDNLEAYEYYLRGKDSWDRRGSTDHALASIDMLQKSVEMDPDFAEAWAALSVSYAFLGWQWDQVDAFPKARTAGEKALELDPALPEAQLALGYLYYYGNREYDNALIHFREALKRRPGDPETEQAIGFILRRQGKWEDALVHLNNALRMNPRSYLLNEELGSTFLLLRRYEEAEHHLNRAVSFAPDISVTYVEIALAHLMKNGNIESAEESLKKGIRKSYSYDHFFSESSGSIIRVLRGTFYSMLDTLTLNPDQEISLSDTCSYYDIKAELAYFRNDRQSASAFYDTLRILLEPVFRPENKSPHTAYYHAYLGIAYAGLGLDKQAIEQGKQALELLPVSMDAVDGPVIEQFMTEIYMRCGDYEAALDKIELLLTVPAYLSVPLLRIDPLWDPLRDHPRFQHLLDKYSGDRS